MKDDTRTIEQRFIEAEASRRELEQVEARAEETRNRNRKIRADIERINGEIEELQERILQGRKTIQGNSNLIKEMPSVKEDIDRLRGLIAYQDNRSKQFKTIIKRGY